MNNENAVEPDDEELLLGRVVGRAERPSDWDALEALARADDGVLARLAGALRQDAVLRAVGDEAEASAGRVALPPAARPARRPVLAPRHFAAAALALLAGLAGFGLGRAGDAAPAGTARGGDADLAVLGRSEVLGELLSEVLETRPAEGGEGFEILYVRHTLHRERVEDLFELGLDEHARPAPRPARADPIQPASSF